MKITKSKLRKIIREELLREATDIDKMADEIINNAKHYSKNIKHYHSLDGDVFGGMTNGQKKYEAMQKLLVQVNKELIKFGKTWVTKYQKSVDRIMKS